MTLTLNRAGKRAFYASIRKSRFKRGLTQSQVDGIEAIIAACMEAGWGVAWTAYALATAFHETARTMQPIKEYGGRAYFMRMYDKTGNRPHVARDLGNTKVGDGALFCGRGYPQLTGRRNYTLLGELLGIDLVGNPDLALRPDIAAKIMVLGMERGLFTGKRLADYFGNGRNDPVNARRIINGKDKANTIAGYHRDFLHALEVAVTATQSGPVGDAMTHHEPDVKPVDLPPMDKKDATGPVATGGGATAAIESGHPWGWYIAGAILVVGAIGTGWFLYRKYEVEVDAWIDRRKVDLRTLLSSLKLKVKDRFA